MDAKIELLKSYIRFLIIPILIDKEMEKLLSGDIAILNSNCNDEELNGTTDSNNEFLEPNWYKEAKKCGLLLIKDIDKISLDDQDKFLGLLKDRKIGTMSLSEDCIMLLSYSSEKVSDNILDICAKI